jgi:hypothetical protein
LGIVENTTLQSHTPELFEAAKTALQDFQVRRLKRDFRDLRLSPEYGPFTEFFATEIYSAKDFTERNESFRKLTSQFRGVLGDEIYTGLVRLLDLHSLTDQLDDKMTEILVAAGTPTNFTETQYEKAYRDLDNYDERLSQIHMILDSLRFTHHVSQMTFIGVVLKSAKLAAGLFTRDRTVGMLEHAYSTLRGIKNIEYLVGQVESREVDRLNRIYGLDS